MLTAAQRLQRGPPMLANLVASYLLGLATPPAEARG